MSEKVFWRSSIKDIENIDLDEILKDNSPSKQDKTLSGRNRNRSGSSNRLTSGQKPLKRIEVNDEMSKQEMIQIIESQKREIKYLQEKVGELEQDKDQMVDNFQLSSGVLLERLKDLEQFKSEVEIKQILPSLGLGDTMDKNQISDLQRSYMPNNIFQIERPQTAQVLSKIQQNSNYRKLGPSGKNPSTAASSGGQDSLNSSRGFGELGSTKRTQPLSRASDSMDQLPLQDELSSDEEQPRLEKMTCPNCQKEIKSEDMAAHTLLCYRNSTKCKVCGKVIQKDKKKEHLNRWRNLEMMIDAITNDRDEQVVMHFDHGIDCNMQFKSKEHKKTPKTAKSKLNLPVPDANNQNREDWTPMHFAAENGSLNVILAMVSRGAGIDPADTYERTPLMIAIENNKSAVARSLIEFGADIEITDIYGKTPLMYACKVASIEIVELLIKCKANVQAVNKIGDSAVTMAQKSGNQDIMMILVKSGASIRPSSRARLPQPISK